MKKRILAIVFSTIMALSLAACSGTKEKTSTSDDTKQEVTEEREAPTDIATETEEQEIPADIAAKTEEQEVPADTAAETAVTEEQPQQLQTYTSKSGTFSISLPDIDGGWIEAETSNDYHLVLDNSDQSFTILIQALPMEDAQYTFSDLDEVVDLHRQITLSGFGEPAEAEVTIGNPAVSGVKAYFYEVTQDNTTAKAVVSYFETENAYYILTLTGIGDIYDANIDSAQSALTSFTESR